MEGRLGSDIAAMDGGTLQRQPRPNQRGGWGGGTWRLGAPVPGEGFAAHLAWLDDNVRPDLVSITSCIKRRQTNNKEIKREACQQPSHKLEG